MLDRDHAGVFRFASLQSGLSKELLKKYGKNPADLDTFYAILDYGTPQERILSRGRAGIFVLDQIGGIYKPAGLLAVMPNFVLDLGYDTVAKHRYRWFGKLDACPLPKPGDAARFLDASA